MAAKVGQRRRVAAVMVMAVDGRGAPIMMSESFVAPSFIRAQAYFGGHQAQAGGHLAVMGQLLEGAIVSSCVNVSLLRLCESVAHVSAPVPAALEGRPVRLLATPLMALHCGLSCAAAYDAARAVASDRLQMQRRAQLLHRMQGQPGDLQGGTGSSPTGSINVPAGFPPLSSAGTSSGGTGHLPEQGASPAGAARSQGHTMLPESAGGVGGSNGASESASSVLCPRQSPDGVGGGGDGEQQLDPALEDPALEAMTVKELGGPGGILSLAGVEPQWVVEMALGRGDCRIYAVIGVS